MKSNDKDGAENSEEGLLVGSVTEFRSTAKGLSERNNSINSK